jgi:hypothetical protein
MTLTEMKELAIKRLNDELCVKLDGLQYGAHSYGPKRLNEADFRKATFIILDYDIEVQKIRDLK